MSMKYDTKYFKKQHPTSVRVKIVPSLAFHLDGRKVSAALQEFVHCQDLHEAMLQYRVLMSDKIIIHHHFPKEREKEKGGLLWIGFYACNYNLFKLKFDSICHLPFKAQPLRETAACHVERCIAVCTGMEEKFASFHKIKALLHLLILG